MIRLADVHREYKMAEETVGALRGISVEIGMGEYVAITGPSGSGKSTMLHLVGGLDRPSSGKVIVDDRSLGDMSDGDLARYRNRYAGFVFQSFNLQTSMTALENVALPLMLAGVPKGERLARARVALESLGLADRAKHRPGQLSGGQAQRVAIARAVVNEPKLLLCDEPTGNLDSRTGEGIIDLLSELNRDRKVTVLVVTHDPRVAERAPRVISLLDGVIVDDVARASA